MQSFRYQEIKNVEESQIKDHSEEVKSLATIDKSRTFIVIMASVITCTFVFSLIYFSHSNTTSLSCRAADPILHASNSFYCQTHCENPCNKFQSVYGELCCDWMMQTDGSKSCSLTITSDDKCLCSTSSTSNDPPISPPESSISYSTPSLIPTIVLQPVPTNDKNNNHKAPHTKKKNDDFWNTDDDNNGGFKPIPWMPWTPITVPEGATECLKSCHNPCGVSQINGHSYCCESNGSHSCSISTINGKCYCG